ncbi:fumarylacetoacetate hydrolase family protein [Marinomonas spartinae]|uniref:fumarylacetoacetate hydrolase family protein n=1 Tax=Marinomonas spartinae TaxID=1792290 RepID=UPI0018F117FB|nr:fumarylacetoacetate hydrolase family protein [Marinomonas spartinae]MBJ7555993.1 fumarylacetoacetate hydrolase family protein [Marinomonas spartinae]
MKLATIDNGTRDGALVIVSCDGQSYLPAPEKISTLQMALDNWSVNEPVLQAVYPELKDGKGMSTASLSYLAPLPRAWQWLDGSAFKSHGDLMDQAFGFEPKQLSKPLMYQGMSHQFLSATADVPFMREEDGIDFEGEFAVIVDDVPMGVSAMQALKHIKLLILLNDWSLRTIAIPEMKTGFGWVQAKPACSVAPVALTPDELGVAWHDGRVHLDLVVDWNGKRFGGASGGEMGVGFHDLIAHAAATRDLCAGTIIGSGTVSNKNYREVGSSCIAERRGMETLDTGAAKTAYMSFGDQVRMEAISADIPHLFGIISQKVIKKTS